MRLKNLNVAIRKAACTFYDLQLQTHSGDWIIHQATRIRHHCIKP
ncbi:hypothetical protein [Kingella denitrificans]|nr:hypothetical protein [Kingella denitrificans]